MRLCRCLFASKQRLLFESPALFEGVNIIRMGVNIVRMHTKTRRKQQIVVGIVRFKDYL